MLFWVIIELLALTSLALGQPDKMHASVKARLSRRQANDSLDAIEATAHSRLPNLPLPESISASTKSLLQFITIWEDNETAMLRAITSQVAQNASGYTDFGIFTRDEVFGILKTNLAEAELQLNYTIQLLEHYKVPLIPVGCTHKGPLLGLELIDDLRALSSLNSLLIDSLQDASKTMAENGDGSLIPILWGISTSKAEQNGFYLIFNWENPSERAFMTSIPPELAYGTFTQLIKECPFPIDAIYPVAVPLYEDWIDVNQTFTYCANLSHVPSDISKLSFTILVGNQVPITIPVRNVELNGTIIFFDSDFPRKQYILEGMAVGALNQAPPNNDTDIVGNHTLASTYVQFYQPLKGTPGMGGDPCCPRAGGSEFWDLIAP